MWTQPAIVGMSIAEVDTPALLVDLDVFEANVALMAAFASEAGVSLRAHAKSHKCPEIVRIQLAAGACGICCQKVSEAEVFADHGVGDILISNEVVGPRKLARVAELATRVKLSICVDDLGNIAALDAAMASTGAQLDVLVEIDVGHGRCGAAPGRPAAELARALAESEHLNFAGLQAYHGSAQHFRASEERRAAIEAAIAMVRMTEEALEREGLRCRTIAGAGTGTFPIEAASGVYTELQCGSYIFMDADYGRNRGEDGQPAHRFRNSLFLLSTVMSVARPGRAICDAGLKSQSVDSGLPLVHELPGVAYVGASDEHGVLEDPQERLQLGDRVRLIPGHCDPTVNLHDWLVGYRGDRVETVWPISARGCVF